MAQNVAMHEKSGTGFNGNGADGGATAGNGATKKEYSTRDLPIEKGTSRAPEGLEHAPIDLNHNVRSTTYLQSRRKA